MNILTLVSDIDGKQGGRKSPTFFLLALMIFAGLLPQTVAANTTYLKNNTDDFLERIEESYGQMINIAALLHDYDAKLITAVIVVESEGKPSAVSHKGAKGLMQLMPGTARAMGASDAKDPFQNILAGTKYLKELDQRYGFKNREDALVAYNMGPSRAKRWLSQYEPGEYAYVQKVMYVYGVLAQNELDAARVAIVATKNADLATAFPRPIMTKPQSRSLSSLPLSLPASRRGELATQE